MNHSILAIAVLFTVCVFAFGHKVEDQEIDLIRHKWYDIKTQLNGEFSVWIPMPTFPWIFWKKCLVHPPYNNGTVINLMKEAHPKIARMRPWSKLGPTCGITVNSLTKEDEGNWIIEAVLEHTKEPFLFNVTATVHLEDIEVTLSPNSITKSEGESVRLLLNVRSELPSDDPELSSCVAIAPSGLQVEVAPNSEVGSEHPRIGYSPSQNGSLSAGDCGIVLSNIQPEDRGKWTVTATHNSSKVVFRGASFLNVPEETNG